MPTNLDVQLHAGKLLIAAGQFSEARARAEAVLDKDARNVNALIVLGNALAGLKDIDQAIVQLETVVDQNPALTFGYTNLGALELRKGNQAAAESAFKRAVEVNAKSLDAHLNLANFYWAQNKGLAAEGEFKAALAVDPKSAPANQMLATLYLMNGRGPEAEPYLKAYADVEKTVGARVTLADYYLSTKRTKEATAILEQLSKEPAGEALAQMRLAVIDFSANRRPEAHRRLADAVKKEPKNALLLETRGGVLVLDQKYDEASSHSTPPSPSTLGPRGATISRALRTKRSAARTML